MAGQVHPVTSDDPAHPDSNQPAGDVRTPTPGDHHTWVAGAQSREQLTRPSPHRGTVAIFEDGARYGWQQPVTRAIRVGDGWRLDGTKVHVADAVGADVVLVTAVDPDGRLDVKDVERQIAWFRAQGLVKGSFAADAIIASRYILPWQGR